MGVLVISGSSRFFVPARIPSRFPGINMCRPLPQASLSDTLHLAKPPCRLGICGRWGDVERDERDKRKSTKICNG